MDFTGSKLISAADHQNLAKILGIFANVRALILNGTGIKDLGFIGEILCTKFLRCRRLDLTGHTTTKEEVAKFIDILEGRSLTKDVTPFWLAVGGEMRELLTANAGCNPHTGNGCYCKSKRVVHVVATLQAPTAPTTTVAKLPLRRARRVPPPPKEVPPPSPPRHILACAEDFAMARNRLGGAMDLQREKGRAIIHGGVQYVLVSHQNKFALVDCTSIENGQVMEIGGTWLRMENLQLAPGEDGIIQAIAEEYFIGGAQCATPDSYLHTDGGDFITFRIGDFSAGGWVAAMLDYRGVWKWLPLSKCVVP